MTVRRGKKQQPQAIFVLTFSSVTLTCICIVPRPKHSSKQISEDAVCPAISESMILTLASHSLVRLGDRLVILKRSSISPLLPADARAAGTCLSASSTPRALVWRCCCCSSQVSSSRSRGSCGAQASTAQRGQGLGGGAGRQRRQAVHMIHLLQFQQHRAALSGILKPGACTQQETPSTVQCEEKRVCL